MWSFELTAFAQIELSISKFHNRHWTFDLSMKYACGHVATSTNGFSLEKAVQGGLSEFKSDLRIHEFQWSIETFHFDKCGDDDYHTEINRAVLPSKQKKIKALVLEDDPAASVVLQATLETHGCVVDQFALPQQALNAIIENRYDLLILDWNLPYMKGGEFLAAADLLLQKSHLSGQPQRQIPVVICTSMPFSSILGSIDEIIKKVSVHQQSKVQSPPSIV